MGLEWLRNLVAGMSMGKLRWFAIVAPAMLFLLWEYLSHFLIHAQITSELLLFLVTVAAIGLGASGFTLAFFRLLERMQRQIFRQNRELASRTAALETLYEIGTSLSALLDVRVAKETAVRRAQQLLGSDAAGLALLHEPAGEVRWELLVGATSEQFRDIRLERGQGVAGKAMQSGEPVIIEDVASLAADLSGRYPVLAVEHLQAALVVPVRIGGEAIGALMVAHRTPYSFQLNDLKLLMSLANQVAVAINNAQLRERLGALSALEERERLAREMHDGLAQLLGGIAARATSAGEHLAQGRTREAREQLTRLREGARDAYVDVRQSILGLRSPALAGGGLSRALDEYTRRLGEQEGITVHLESGEGPQGMELTAAAEVQAIRIIQEALSNVRKHSRTDEAWVRVYRDGGWARINVEDRGQGFHPAPADGKGGHFGLQTMRERAEAVGGRLAVESRPGRGTVVTVQLPLGGEE